MRTVMSASITPGRATLADHPFITHAVRIAFLTTSGEGCEPSLNDGGTETSCGLKTGFRRSQPEKVTAMILMAMTVQMFFILVPLTENETS